MLNHHFFFTIVANNYYSYALTLRDSLQKTYGEKFTFFVVICDKIIKYHDTDHISLIHIDDLQIPDLYNFKFRYDVMELATAIKPYVFKKLFKQKKINFLSYIDPDLYFLSPIHEAESKLINENYSIFLTPHLLEPISENDKHVPGELDIMRAGTFNLGYISVKNSPVGKNFILWWCSKLERHAFNSQSNGLFTDQKWIDFVPSLFDEVFIYRGQNFNVAYWNLFQRKLHQINGKLLDANQKPIRFLHFSGINPNERLFSKHQNRFTRNNIGVLKNYFDNYTNKILSHSYNLYSKLPYAYNFYSDKTLIKKEHRYFYHHFLKEKYHNPFKMPKLSSYVIDGFINNKENFHQIVPFINKSLLNKKIISLNNKRFLYLLMVLLKILTIRLGLYSLLVKIYLNFIKRTVLEKKFFHFKEIFNKSNSDDLSKILHNIFSKLSIQSSKKGYISIIGYIKGNFGLGQYVRNFLSIRPYSKLKYNIFNINALMQNNSNEEVACKFDKSFRTDINLFFVNADAIENSKFKFGFRRHFNSFNVGIWFWELSELPSQYIDMQKHLDCMIAPSKFLYKVFQKDLNIPVLYLPPVIEFPKPNCLKKSFFGIPDNKFCFYFSFDYLSFVDRKNPFAALDAFKSAFKNNNNVIFFLKILNSNVDYEQKIKAKYKNVVIFSKTLTYEQNLSIYDHVDCFVSLHRAEGLGLNVAEAMFFNTPVITTGYSGVLDFANEENALLVDYKLVKVKKNQYIYYKNCYWAEPDIDDAAKKMRNIYNNKRLRDNLATNAKNYLESNFSKKVVAKKFDNLINQINDFRI